MYSFSIFKVLELHSDFSPQNEQFESIFILLCVDMQNSKEERESDIMVDSEVKSPEFGPPLRYPISGP